MAAAADTSVGSLQTLMANQLVDMEWRFGITASSSELSHSGTSFLQLKLVLDKGNTREPVNIELSLPQFYELLQEMEKAKTALSSYCR